MLLDIEYYVACLRNFVTSEPAVTEACVFEGKNGRVETVLKQKEVKFDWELSDRIADFEINFYNGSLVHEVSREFLASLGVAHAVPPCIYEEFILDLGGDGMVLLLMPDGSSRVECRESK
jgi:hypothetical protein